MNRALKQRRDGLTPGDAARTLCISGAAEIGFVQ